MLSCISFIFFFPGIYLSMLQIHTSGSVKAPLTEIGIQFFNTSNSILNTVHDLFYQQHYLVSVLIFLFSIVVPLFKGISLIFIILTKNIVLANKLLRGIQAIAKWSMCDVFVVSIFLAYLSTGSRNTGNAHQTTFLGIPIDIDVFINMTAKLEVGFYCFLAYCILSLVALQVYTPRK